MTNDLAALRDRHHEVCGPARSRPRVPVDLTGGEANLGSFAWSLSGRGAYPVKIAVLVPVGKLSALSVAVIVWGPKLLRVAVNVPVPLVRVVSAGRIAAPAVLVKWTVPV
jgi:hypothetical protein